jgi:hypothetical protein
MRKELFLTYIQHQGWLFGKILLNRAVFWADIFDSVDGLEYSSRFLGKREGRVWVLSQSKTESDFRNRIQPVDFMHH